MGIPRSLPGSFSAIPAAAKAGIFVLLSGAALPAQNLVNVQVALDKPVNVITTESIGVYTNVYDTNTINPKVPAYLHAAGIYTIQFPGGYGSYADLYHWNTGGGTKYENFAKQDHFFPGEANMAHMVPFLDSLGTALLTVNYGSNEAGTGGGEPAAAAAWVAYMNGDPASTQALGKDSTGKDWKTVGYWASLRGAAPLASDDGLNQLRANHPKPLGIEFWQIGSEVYNNGFYGGDHKSEEDLHAPYPASESENEKRRKNPNLSPTFYGERLNEFSKAMKAVDPKVKIGATLNLAPIDSAWGLDWNPEVLKAACAAIDFEAFVWRPDFRNGPEYQTRDEAGILSSPEQQIGQFLSEALYDGKKFCPAGHIPRVAVTQMAPIHWPKVIPSKLTDALFAADAMALLIETGTINSDWTELHDGYFMDNSSQPGPAFFGIQMLHIIAFRPGDQFVSASTSNPVVAAHAVRRANGTFGVILINKDQSTPAEVKINVAGETLAGSGSRFDYGPANFKVNGPVARSEFKAGGNSFTVTVPPYTITDIVLLKAPLLGGDSRLCGGLGCAGRVRGRKGLEGWGGVGWGLRDPSASPRALREAQLRMTGGVGGGWGTEATRRGRSRGRRVFRRGGWSRRWRGAR